MGEIAVLEMEEVQGLVQGLGLSKAKKIGLKIRSAEKNGVYGEALEEPHDVGRLFLKRSTYAGVIGQTLEKIWCPIKGLVCKELEDNTFLFTFRQASVWRRAIEDVPWWFLKELLVMEEFDRNKTVEEYEFNIIPTCIRVFGLPLGSMNRVMGELINKDFHQLVEVDDGHDGKAVGNFLRLKVRLNIMFPLMRSFLLEREEEEPKGKLDEKSD
ncbi:hypothetical protein D1007_36599 [Hordeum vulgare]|nr:hypothetical protein D1007_36599 [Hordeum vulgare]